MARSYHRLFPVITDNLIVSCVWNWSVGKVRSLQFFNTPLTIFKNTIFIMLNVFGVFGRHVQVWILIILSIINVSGQQTQYLLFVYTIINSFVITNCRFGINYIGYILQSCRHIFVDLENLECVSQSSPLFNSLLMLF